MHKKLYKHAIKLENLSLLYTRHQGKAKHKCKWKTPTLRRLRGPTKGATLLNYSHSSGKRWVERSKAHVILFVKNAPITEHVRRFDAAGGRMENNILEKREQKNECFLPENHSEIP